jgi:hypothetical protein
VSPTLADHPRIGQKSHRRVGNYLIADPSNLGNFMIADTVTRARTLKANQQIKG